MKKFLTCLSILLILCSCGEMDLMDDLPQDVVDALIELKPQHSLDFEAGGGTQSVEFSTSNSNMLVCVCDSPWVNVQMTQTVNGLKREGVVNISLDPNRKNKSRSVEVYILGDTGERKTKRSISCYQKAMK